MNELKIGIEECRAMKI